MPREELNIERFDVGLVTSVDPKDVSLDAATDGSWNLEAVTAHGKLLGRASEAASICSAFTGALWSGLVHAVGGYGALLSTNGSTVNYTRWNSGGFLNECTSLGSVTSPTGMTVFNREVRVGSLTTPRVAGYTEKNGSESLFLADCECHPLSTVTNSTPIFDVLTWPAWGGAVMDPNIAYFWKVAIEYDNSQESVLNATQIYDGTVSGPHPTGHLHNRIYNSEIASVCIEIPNSVFDNQRVTGIVLYRASAPWNKVTAENGATFSPMGEWRLEQRIALDDPMWSMDCTTYGFPPRSGYKRGILGATSRDGQTYELRNGISDTLDSNFVAYRLSAIVNSEFIVAQCTHADVDDAMQMIFKSKPNRPDIFNWTEDYIKMPTVPVCMCGFNGRLFVFDQAAMYIVNTGEMYIEDSLPGVGAWNAQSVVATHHGLFILDKNMAYLHDGTQLVPIGVPIADKWRAEPWSVAAAVWHEQSGCVLFMNLDNASAFAYNVANKRWDYWIFANAALNVVTDIGGTVMLVI